MKLTYDNLNNIALINGYLVDKQTGTKWEESDVPCASCGDFFLRARNTHTKYCEPQCIHVGPMNSIRFNEISHTPVNDGSLRKSRRKNPAKIKYARNDKKEQKDKFEDTKTMIQRDTAKTKIGQLYELQKEDAATKEDYEVIKKMIAPKRRAHTQETKDKISAANKGKTRSLETRAKMSRRRLGTKYIILPKDGEIAEQMRVLRRNGQDLGVIASIAVKQEFHGIMKTGKTLLGRFLDLFKKKEPQNA